MYKFICKIFFLTAVMFILCGCGGTGAGSKVVDGTVRNVVTKQEEERISAPEVKKQDEDKGYVFIASDIEIFVDEDAGPYIEKLGEAGDYYEAPSCAFDGMDRVYVYEGFEIDTYPSKTGDKVLSVVLLSDSVSTSEGVCIGMTLDEVTDIYGESYESDGVRIVYSSNGMKLCFGVQDGIVTSIDYLSRVYD